MITNLRTINVIKHENYRNSYLLDSIKNLALAEDDELHEFDFVQPSGKLLN